MRADGADHAATAAGHVFEGMIVKMSGMER